MNTVARYDEHGTRRSKSSPSQECLGEVIGVAGVALKREQPAEVEVADGRAVSLPEPDQIVIPFHIGLLLVCKV